MSCNLNPKDELILEMLNLRRAVMRARNRSVGPHDPELIKQLSRDFDQLLDASARVINITSLHLED